MGIGFGSGLPESFLCSRSGVGSSYGHVGQSLLLVAVDGLCLLQHLTLRVGSRRDLELYSGLQDWYLTVLS